MALPQLHQQWNGPLADAFYRAKEILAQTQQQEIKNEREKHPGPVDPKLTTDEFRMYSFKIDACPHLGEIHDVNACPYLHPGEKARRRDPRVFTYQALPCPDFRKGSCKRGDGCHYGHGVFECWLHPSKYRTTLCKEGAACTRSVCFFAHSLEQLREPTPPATIPVPTAPNTTTTTPLEKPQHHLPPIVTTRISCCDLYHPNSPGSILHEQGCHSTTTTTTTTSCCGGGGSSGSSGGFSFSSRSCSSGGTSRCASPGVTAAAAMESLRLASMSLPSSVDSSLASTPLMSEAVGGSLHSEYLSFIPASSNNSNDSFAASATITKNKMIIKDAERAVAEDAAMAAAVALRAQQQQAAAAAAAAQAVLTRILQTAADHGLPVSQQQKSSSLPPHRRPSLSSTTPAAAEVTDGQVEEHEQEEFALQQLMAELGL